MVIMYVIYAGDSTTRFDRAYWVDEHLPLVRRCWEPFGLISAAAFFPAASGGGMIAICPCMFADETAIETALAAPTTASVMDDVKHFTDVAPVRYLAKSM